MDNNERTAREAEKILKTKQKKFLLYWGFSDGCLHVSNNFIDFTIKDKALQNAVLEKGKADKMLNPEPVSGENTYIDYVKRTRFDACNYLTLTRDALEYLISQTADASGKFVPLRLDTDTEERRYIAVDRNYLKRVLSVIAPRKRDEITIYWTDGATQPIFLETNIDTPNAGNVGACLTVTRYIVTDTEKQIYETAIDEIKTGNKKPKKKETETEKTARRIVSMKTKIRDIERGYSGGVEVVSNGYLAYIVKDTALQSEIAKLLNDPRPSSPSDNEKALKFINWQKRANYYFIAVTREEMESVIAQSRSLHTWLTVFRFDTYQRNVIGVSSKYLRKALTVIAPKKSDIIIIRKSIAGGPVFFEGKRGLTAFLEPIVNGALPLNGEQYKKALTIFSDKQRGGA